MDLSDLARHVHPTDLRHRGPGLISLQNLVAIYLEAFLVCSASIRVGILLPSLIRLSHPDDAGEGRGTHFKMGEAEPGCQAAQMYGKVALI